MTVPRPHERQLELEGRRLTLSNLEKVLWPAAGFTKGQMIDFYIGVAPVLLPHVAGRPLTLRRFPDGVEGVSWYQAQCRGRPDWLPTYTLPDRRGNVHRLCVVDDLPSLVWVANLASIELHPFLFREEPARPTALVLDLDPGRPADVLACCRVAVRLRELLDRHGLVSFPKTSGSVGLHLYVPLNTPNTFSATKAFARSLARRLAAERPELVVDRPWKSLRAGKVLIDWLQNDGSRSLVAPYSLRGTAWPTVSAPVTWAEVEGALAARRPELLTFEAAAMAERLERLGDLFRPVLELEQRLPEGE